MELLVRCWAHSGHIRRDLTAPACEEDTIPAVPPHPSLHSLSSSLYLASLSGAFFTGPCHKDPNHVNAWSANALVWVRSQDKGKQASFGECHGSTPPGAESEAKTQVCRWYGPMPTYDFGFSLTRVLNIIVISTWVWGSTQKTIKSWGSNQASHMKSLNISLRSSLWPGACSHLK